MDELNLENLKSNLTELDYNIPDVLASRYATEPMKQIWSPYGQVLIERFIQVAIMQAQSEMGVNIPQQNIDDYLSVINDIDLDSIRAIEKETKHDVNARIVEFNNLARHQNVGEAMTSRDHTENTEQLQKKMALEIIRTKTVAVIGSFAMAAANYADTPITGRTHNVPAQITTLGKRFASLGEEMIDGYNALQYHIDNLKLRGIKGAVGTQQDMLNLFDSDEAKVDKLDEIVAKTLDFNAIYNSVGQIYPRSQDLESIQSLSGVVGPLSNFATNIRLMQGYGLVTETKKKRVGSNAMPHKINPRTSERINAFYIMLGGYENMLRSLAGNQWQEGDVSCSAVRRVALPGSFFAADGAFEAGLNVLNGFGLFEAEIENEINRYTPFLATTKILTECIKRGVGREDAHGIIREHAFGVVQDMREKGLTENNLLERLGSDTRIPMSYQEIMDSVEKPIDLTGRAKTQVQRFVDTAETIVKNDSQAGAYQVSDIL